MAAKFYKQINVYVTPEMLDALIDIASNQSEGSYSDFVRKAIDNALSENKSKPGKKSKRKKSNH